MKFTKGCSYNNACSYIEQLYKGKDIHVSPSPNMKRIGFYVDDKCVGVYDDRTFKLMVY